MFYVCVFLMFVAYLVICMAILTVARRLRKKQEWAIQELMVLIIDNHCCAKGTSVEPFAERLRHSAEEICDDYDIVIKIEDQPL